MSLAPRRMMPACSCSVPGRYPGTSTSVTTGTLKASQNWTKRPAFSDASTSRVPASHRGWLATMPTDSPSMQAKPTTIDGAKSSCTWTNSP